MRFNSAYAEGDLLNLRDLLEEKTGLYLPEEKLDQLENIFSDSKEGLASTCPQEVIQSIAACSEKGRAYLNKLIAGVATNETYFFRTSPHFEVLKNYVLPELLQAKSSQGKKTLKIWSAGCSTGEEPFSLAILLLETLPDIDAWEVTILATDIDLDALERAEMGIYRPWSFRGVDPEIIRAYFRPEDGERLRIDDRIRNLVTFQPLNLKSDLYPSSFFGTTDLDIIFCRNVTIYFRQKTTLKVVRRFYDCLNEGGFLLTGAAEYSPQIYQDFKARVFPETVIYQKLSFKERISPPKAVSPLWPPSNVWQPPRPPATEAKIDQAAQKNNERDPVDEALDFLSEGEVDRALVFLAGLAKKNPQDSRACFLLGQISADRHHLREAAYWLSRTLVLDPLHLGAHYFLGLLCIEEGKMNEAIQSLKKTIYIDSNFALGHFYLGKIYKDQGQIEKAYKSFASVKSLLGSASRSETLRGAEGITAQQLLTLIDRELDYER